jgi:subtilisin family serine protease
MSLYIVKLDKANYPGGDTEARSAMSSAGIAVEKAFQLSPLMYLVNGDANDIDSLPGLMHKEQHSTGYNVSLENLNTDHLKLTVDSAGTTEFNPKYTGNNVDIYLVDTGVNQSHTEFQGSTINDLYTNFENNYSDDVGHGTAMASLLVGQNIGAAKDAQLHNVKLFGNSNSTVVIGEIIDALESVLVQHNTSSGNNIAIVCAPWVINFSALLNDVVESMLSHGIIFVCAAGNSSADVENFSPASVKDAITVGAYNRNFEVTSFTNTPWTNNEPTEPTLVNYGRSLDIFALGVDVTAASIGANDDYLQATGTSTSAAIAAGVLAHYIEAHQNRSSAEIKQIFLMEGHYLGRTNLVFDNQNSNVDYSEVNSSVVTTERIDENSLTTKPSGRLTNIKAGETAQVDLGLNSNATEVELLDFAPAPSWITVDLSTGIVTVDAGNLTNETVPGNYIFALKGNVNDQVLVEEFAVGVYQDSEAELASEDVSAFYYDADSDAYDEVADLSLASKF